jgi:hypothetical protein
VTIEAVLISFVAAPIAIVSFALLLLFKASRKIGKWGLLLALATMFGTPMVSQFVVDGQAQAEGFASQEDRALAHEAGFRDPREWAGQRSSVMAAKQLEADPACVADVSCWAKRHLQEASRVCSAAVEQQARFDFRWEASRPDRFTSAIMHNNGRQISFIGDALKLQNGFGAWLTYSYNCRYDVGTQAVVAVQVTEGRM